MKPTKQAKSLSRRQFISHTGVVATGLTCWHTMASFTEMDNFSSIPKSSIQNPTSFHFYNEPVRLNTVVKGTSEAIIIRRGGKEIPFQAEMQDGVNHIWICGDFAPGAREEFELLKGTPGTFSKLVHIHRQEGFYLLENGKISVKIPSHAGSDIPGPIAGIQLSDGRMAGSSFWKTDKKLKKFTSTVVGDGTVFAKIRLRYDFEGQGGANAFSEIEIMLTPEWEHVSIQEKHEMGADDYWELDLSNGWSPDRGISKQFNNGPGGDGIIVVPPPNRSLLPIKNVCFSEELYINLIPRWNQHFKDGWAFAATDGNCHLCAVAVQASQWKWPHDNSLQCVVKPDGKYAAVRCSTRRGERRWWLSPTLLPAEPDYIAKNVWENLNKINHDYMLDWPEKPTKWWSTNPYDSELTNPTHTIRKIGKAALKNAGQPADETTLIRFQTLIHNDCWGSYWDYFSPENPNFFTDYNLVPIALATNLKDHPHFEKFRKLAENKFREDLYHSITLPGGAGQECPGYSHYGMSLWKEIVEMGEKHLGFEMKFIDERLDASEKFYQRISYPDGEIRRGSPVGDSHPDRAGNSGMPKVEVALDIVKTWKTEEFPGFGVLYSHHPGTVRETYLSFKSGPNRCHYHGDQLSFHYCANGRPLVVDHHCSYHPRAGQEHMHNRMAFFTDEMPFANMDGYERILAFKTSESVDVTVAQVESNRLRAVLPEPPEAWDARFPQLKFREPLVYRRTVVLVKNGTQDYFVFRDQFWADRSIQAAYCLHAYGSTPYQERQTINFGNLTLFCNRTDFKMKCFDWSHNNGGYEATKGVRIEISGSSGEMITVIYPGTNPPAMKNIPGGVRVGDDQIVFAGNNSDFGTDTEIVRIVRSGAKLLTLNGNELDPDHFQGEIGLFVPDAGYPFGDIPDWLAKQRAFKPAWAKEV